MNVAITPSRARSSIVALAAVLLTGCAGAGGSRPGGLETVPVMQPAHAGVFSFAPGAPVLQTLDVPLGSFGSRSAPL